MLSLIATVSYSWRSALNVTIPTLEIQYGYHRTRSHLRPVTSAVTGETLLSAADLVDKHEMQDLRFMGSDTKVISSSGSEASLGHVSIPSELFPVCKMPQEPKGQQLTCQMLQESRGTAGSDMQRFRRLMQCSWQCRSYAGSSRDV